MAAMLVFFCMLIGGRTAIALTTETCDVSQRSVVLQSDAKAYIGVIMSMHGSSTVGGHGCGEVLDNMQTFEAMRWAVSRLNQDTGSINSRAITDSYVPGIKIGLKIQDSCSKAESGMRSLLDFVPSIQSKQQWCTPVRDELFLGVMGGMSIDTTAEISDILKDHQIGQISFSPSSQSLNRRGRYPYLVRTAVSNPMEEASAIVGVLKSLNWTYIAVVYTDDGRDAFDQFLNAAQQNNVCVTMAKKIAEDGNSKEEIEAAIAAILSTTVGGVVLLGNEQAVGELLSTAMSVENADLLQWFVPFGIGNRDNVVRRDPYARGVITMSPTTRHIAEFEDHWVQLDETDPPSESQWYKEWFMTVNKCRLSGVNYAPFSSYDECKPQTPSEKRSNYKQTSTTEAAILAVFSFAKALKSAQEQLCGANSIGLCSRLTELSPKDFHDKYIKMLDFTFSMDERVPTMASSNNDPSNAARRVRFDDNGNIRDSPSYDVWNFNNVQGADYAFQKVGQHSSGKTTVNRNSVVFYGGRRDRRLFNRPLSTCSVDSCAMCLATNANAPPGIRYGYHPGSLLLAGLFSVHSAGTSPFSCGALTSGINGGAQLVEAFYYGLERVNDRGILNDGVTLGGLVFDDCESEALARNVQTNVLTGSLKLSRSDGGEIDAALISGFVESNTDGLSETRARTLEGHDAPVVGLWPRVDPLNSFNGILRVVPDVSQHAKTLVLALKKMNWAYVQLVYSDDDRGRNMAELLREMTAISGICVAAEHKLTSPQKEHDMIVNNIQKMPTANIVIVIANASMYSLLMKSFRDRSADLTFVCSIDWGNNGMSLEGLAYTVTEGSLMISAKAHSVTDFAKHLKNTDQKTYNPWFKDWYQLSMNCYLDEQYKSVYTTQCEDTPITEAVGYKENPLSGRVVDAVEALARALHKTLADYCGVKYSGVCYSYRSSPKREQIMYDFLREIHFEKDSGDTFKFVGNEGSVPIEVLNIQRGAFVKLGEYLPSSGLISMDITAMRHKNGLPAPKCIGSCPQCDSLYTTQDYMYTAGDVLLGGLFDVHGQGESPLSCGALNGDEGYPFVEAFMYAIEKVNDGKAPVRSPAGVRLGGLALDACAGPVRAADSVAAFMAGNLELRGDAAAKMDESTLLAWLTHTTTEAAMEVGDVNRDLETAQIQIGPTSAMLADRKRFPTLFTMQLSDDRAADGMMRLAKHMDWKYINIVHAVGAKQRSDAVTEAGKRAGICVLDTYQLGTDGTHEQIVTKLLASQTDIVVVIADFTEINEIMKVNEMTGRSAARLLVIAYDSLLYIEDIRTITVNASQSMLIYTPNKVFLQDFHNYLSKKYPAQYSHHSWFYRYYESLYGCNLQHSFTYGKKCADTTESALTDASNYRRSMRILNVVNAVYSSVQALDSLLKDICGGAYTGICEKFQQTSDIRQRFVEKLEKVAFNDETGANVKFSMRQYDRGHTIFEHNNYLTIHKEVATYKGEALSITDDDFREHHKDTRSECGNRCARCLQTKAEEQFLFSDGDFLIAGIFDVHHKGPSPFTCGDINHQQGIQLLEAFNYAIEEVNSDRGRVENALFNGRLNGVKIGGLALDTCSSTTRAGNLVANLHSGYLALKPKSGQIDTDKIDVYIGAFESDMSMKIADVLNVMDISQISYGSTSMQLRDRAKYPHFLRSVPADDKHARAVIALLKRFDISYVQVVNSQNFDDRQAAAEFVKLASDRDICVAQNISFGAGDKDVAAMGIVSQLLSKRAAKVVIVYLEEEYIGPFLQAVQQNGAARAHGFKFIGSQKWANSQAVLKGDIGLVAADSITLGVETADLSDFDGYLVRKRPGNRDDANPWFDQFYQELLHCSLPGQSQYGDPCNMADPMEVVYAPEYSQDPYVLYTVNAVYSAALGLDIALQKACGENYTGICEAFRDANNRRELVLDGIRQAHFVDATRQIFRFNQDGESSRGYHIYTIKRTSNNRGYIYNNVGTYNDQEQLKIAALFSIEWKSACPDGMCEECPQIGRRHTKYMKQVSHSGINIVGFFDVHKAEGSSLSCGPIDTTHGFQHLLAFFYAIHEVNSDAKRFPNTVDVGGIAADTCGNPLRATMEVFSILSSGKLNYDGTPVDQSSVLAYLTMGDGNSEAAVGLLAPRQITTVSPSAKSDALDAARNYFLRTTASQAQQAAAMAGIATRMNWNYVTLINSDDAMSRSDAEAYIRHVTTSTSVGDSTQCVAAQYTLAKDADLDDARALVKRLAANHGSNVLILYVTPEHARLLLRAIHEEGAMDDTIQRRFVLVGSGAWGDSNSVVSDIQETARGAITLRVHNPISEGFKAYLQSLTVAQHGVIPSDWFEEFWQRIQQCRLENATIVQRQYTRPCAINDRLSEDLIKETGTIYTIIATQALAIAYGETPECHTGSVSRQDCREKFHTALRGIQWNSVIDSDVNSFIFHLKNGHGDLGFDILNYQKMETGYAYKTIGRYRSNLELEKSEYKSYDASGNVRVTEDVISKCPIGSVCDCVHHTGYKGTSSENGGPHTGKQTSPDINDNFNTVWGVILTVLTVIGIVVTLLMFVYLMIFYPVRGGTTVLGYLLLFGVLLMFVLNFAFILNPTEHVCGIRRFSLGFVYALCFACMLLKVLNTWRVGNYEAYDAPSYNRIAHPGCLFLIAAGMTLVQVSIGVEWLILQPPALAAGDQCATNNTDYTHYEQLIMSCIYVMLLIILTIIYSMVTWHSEENHNEAKYVLATSAFTVLIWIAWTLVATQAGVKYQDPAVIIANLINATVILVLLFVRKLYLLANYEKSVKDEKRSRISSIANDDRKDGDMFHNVSYVDDTATGIGSRPVSQLGGSAVLYYDPHLTGADTVY